MRFLWRDYDPDTMAFVETWLDDAAVAMTGMEEGWRADFLYWSTAGGMTPGRDYWGKIVCEGETPFAAVSFCRGEAAFHIMELLVRPSLRGRGYGTALLRELLREGETILGRQIQQATAVVFPGNRPSIRAFEKAGFHLDRAHEDKDALHYRYGPKKSAI